MTNSYLNSLKSFSPNVVIKVGREGKEYAYHGAIIASLSNVIDTALASSMKENRTREFVIKNIEPLDWEDMIEFVTIPTKNRDMTVLEAITLAPHYNMYLFKTGIDLCNHVVEDYFETMLRKLQEEKENVETIDESIAVLLSADQSNLTSGTKKGLEYFERILNDPFFFDEYSIKEYQIKTLVPMICKYKKELCTSDLLLDFPDLTQDEFILNHLFPEFYVTNMKWYAQHDQLLLSVSEGKQRKLQQQQQQREQQR